MSKSQLWIEVIGGNKWYFGRDDNKLNLSLDQLAKALSQINRFGGHTDAKVPYSVAQHSVYVSRLVGSDPRVRMYGLLHDAHEIIVGDMPRPFKWYFGNMLYDFDEMLDDEEDRAQTAIYKSLAPWLGNMDPFAPYEVHEKIKEADIKCMVTEKRDMLSSDVKWEYWDEVERLPFKIEPFLAEEAKEFFINEFIAIHHEMNNGHTASSNQPW